MQILLKTNGPLNNSKVVSVKFCFLETAHFRMRNRKSLR